MRCSSSAILTSVVQSLNLTGARLAECVFVCAVSVVVTVEPMFERSVWLSPTERTHWQKSTPDAHSSLMAASIAASNRKIPPNRYPAIKAPL